MRFIIITSDQGEDIWINETEIAAIAPARPAGTGSQVILKNGGTYRATVTAEEIFRAMQLNRNDDHVFVKVTENAA